MSMLPLAIVAKVVIVVAVAVFDFGVVAVVVGIVEVAVIVVVVEIAYGGGVKWGASRSTKVPGGRTWKSG